MKMFNFKSLLMVVAMCMCLFVSDFVLARGGGSFGGGRSSSFGSGRSSSFGSGRSSSFGSGRSSGGGFWGSSKPAAPAPAQAPISKSEINSISKSPSVMQSKADAALAAKTRQANVTGMTRAQSVEAFKTQNATKYPTSFSSEPKVRPSYIPRSTTVGGRSYPVVYDRIHGGYGYMGSSGWVGYSPLGDALMLSMLMNAANNHQSPTVVVVNGTSGTATVVNSSDNVDDGSLTMKIIFIFLGVAALAAVVVIIISYNSNRNYMA